jgi:acyl carrier protein
VSRPRDRARSRSTAAAGAVRLSMVDLAREKARLREFVTTNFYLSSDSELDDTTSFLERGILDSTGVLELVVFVEKTFDIQVKDDELVPANFDSIAALAGFIARKRRLEVDAG